MNANVDQSWRRQGLLYPTMLIAAIAVIIFSVIGIAAMTGLLPSAVSGYRAADDTPQPAVKRLPQDNPRVLDAPRAARSEPARAGAACAECGVVESVRTLERKGEGGMAGATAGALVGGMLGNHEVSGGGGRTAATVAGVGAASETERNVNTRITYQVRVRMNDGSHRNHYQAEPPKIGVGQRVRLSNGHLLDD